ncbi:hypothetical protein [Magnetospirillum fulvum]|uniref:Uncharacterized protein n=1 Tax=Magnetospirillum fulvum TaxID=1082 RepID=A0A1H6JDP7_MAGFU|nr:hypothetical protein [Magnetospirillum fulvum]SEH57159.1 hypothetical protein SAMN04244559_03014 [Magnetospirillum fulvum]
MTPSKTSFEIHVFADKRWVITEMAADEAAAKAFADNLLHTGNHEAVRVVRDFERLDGTHAETVVLEKKAPEKAPGDLTLAPIAEAPLCTTIEDVYALPSRTAIGRLLRKYLDEVVVTPTEFLHDAKEMKRFGDRGTLLFSAIDRVAGLQSREAGEADPRERRAFLESAWETLQKRARDFAAAKPKPKPPASFAEALTQSAADPDPAFGLMARLTLALLERRSWQGKLELVLAWALEPEVRPEVIDGLLADLVVPAQMVQDLLGFQPNLAAALGQIVDLAEGRAEPAKFAPELFADLNQMFAAGRLPQAQQALMARTIREIGGANPLSRNDPAQEFEMFHRLLHRLVERDRVAGGPLMAEALLQRATRVQNAGGASLVVVESVRMLLGALADGCIRLQFLLTLCAAPLGRAIGAGLTELLRGHVTRADHIDHWCPVRHPPRDRMAALKGANRALLTCEALDEKFRAGLAARVDAVMARYLQSEGVIEKIDKTDDPLAMRAIRLVKFCGSGVLIEGQSLDMAKARVIEHLRQKQFEEKFLASVPDPAQAEKALRDFHRLLVECGFG